MPLFNTTWTLKDVSVEARQAAARAASADGEDLGIWLGRLIKKANAAEMSAVSEPAAAGADGVEKKLTSIERAMQRPDSGEVTGNLSTA